MNTPQRSTRFAEVRVAQAAAVHSRSDGDLWPAAWADDDALYAGHGDGKGFDLAGDWVDIGVNRIHGTPTTGITGELLAHGDAVSPIWSGDGYNRKPTGMIAVDGDDDGKDELYLAVQDLPCEGPETFNNAPASSVVRSNDYGRTWHATAAPMFTDHLFTTVMFVDHGRSNSRAARAEGRGDYVYAFGLDDNWRTSYSQTVPDPIHVYLGRVLASHIQDRSAWEFFAGVDDHDDAPIWTSNISDKSPVLTDMRRIYEEPGEQIPGGQTPLAQGGVVYNPGLDCYLYLSWTEYTFQFYEADDLWGPWRLFHEEDFGPYPWRGPADELAHYGGYATSAPSKFISEDGRRMWVQSNWFFDPSWSPDFDPQAHDNSYHFNLRTLEVTPAD